MALTSNYQQFIHILQYARFTNPGRESWEQTVTRTANYLFSLAPVEPELQQEITLALLNCDIVPSMRAMWSAGPALARENTCGYNCSYLPIDSLNSFVELLYILMCQAGVGFSVEQHYIDKLPDVPHTIVSNSKKYTPDGISDVVNNFPKIVITDSREGWALGYREFLNSLFNGKLLEVDYSLIRPEGARLRITGGRASGPEPLRKLITYTTEIVLTRLGSRLSGADAHCLCCMEGQCVVAGGVRRSATISLSDLGNEEMRKLKTGKWLKDKPFLSIANNSAVYHGKPSREVFNTEWKSLELSYSGERGIFNRTAAQAQASRHGKRCDTIEYGVNPCCEIILRPREFCNLTEIIIREKDSPEQLMRKVRLATIVGTLQSLLTKFNEDILSPTWRLNCEEERLLGVSFTGIMDNPLTRTPGPELRALLTSLREEAVRVNKIYAERWHINPSAAITCVKPSGNASQLTDTSSGIHPRYASTYLRRVRLDRTNSIIEMIRAEYPVYEVKYGPQHSDYTDITVTTTNSNITSFSNFASYVKESIIYDKDKLSVTHRVNKVAGVEQVTSLLYSQLRGIIIEHDRNGRELTLGFPFHVNNTVTREQVTALDQLELWLLYNEYWCDHKPSITVYVRENEWDSVGEWVYQHFESISGLAFLPYDGGIYEQAPYTPISLELYHKLVVETPKIDWSKLAKYEVDDNRANELAPACSAGGCDN